VNESGSPRRRTSFPLAVEQLKEEGILSNRTRLRQSKYLNNLVEQDHRFIKRRVNPGLGFFSFKTAQRTISTLATAGDILIAGQSDGLFVALDAETGERLWRFQCGAGVNAPPVTYEVNGRQYVAVAAGGNSKERDLTGLAGERFFQNGGTIFVFTLPGLKSR